MGERTSIAWTDATWNFLRGCSRESEGCRNCYAETVAARFSGPGQPYEGLAKWVDRPDGRRDARWTGIVRFVPEALHLPLRWTRPRMVFVNSVSDPFHPAVSRAWVDEGFRVMAKAKRHTFQILTKRPEGLRAYLLDPETPDRVGADVWPLPNVWAGVSVEDQPSADVRLPYLLGLPAAVTFASYEPAIGPIDWRLVPVPDWVIVGGESGPRARRFELEWAARTVRDVAAAGGRVFVKQLGSQPTHHGKAFPIHDRKGEEVGDWPDYIRVRDWPEGFVPGVAR